MAGWVIPLVFVQRTMRACPPFVASDTVVSHCLKLYLPSSRPSFVGSHVRPESS